MRRLRVERTHVWRGDKALAAQCTIDPQWLHSAPLASDKARDRHTPRQEQCTVTVTYVIVLVPVHPTPQRVLTADSEC